MAQLFQLLRKARKQVLKTNSGEKLKKENELKDTAGREDTEDRNATVVQEDQDVIAGRDDIEDQDVIVVRKDRDVTAGRKDIRDQDAIVGRKDRDVTAGRKDIKDRNDTVVHEN